MPRGVQAPPGLLFDNCIVPPYNPSCQLLLGSAKKGVVDTAREELLSAEEVADRVGVSIYTVWRWIKQGKLRAFKPGREYRVREADLEEFLAAREVHPKAPGRSPFEPTFNDVLEDERRGYESHVRERINSLGRAADQWQRFVDEGLYDLKRLDLETLKVVDAASLALILAYATEEAEMKRAAADEQRERLEQAEQRLIDTNLDFWARVESELARREVADHDELEAKRALNAQRARWPASRSNTA